MQITRETIALETPFVFDNDSCEGCGGKLGYDLFVFDSGISVNGVVNNKKEEERVSELITEFKELASVNYEKLSKLKESEKTAIFDRMDVIVQKLYDMGIELIQPEFHLLVYYGESFSKGAGAEAGIVEPNGTAYVKLLMIEELPDSIRYAQIFQGTCNDTVQFKLVYDMCVGGLRNEIVTKEEIESGEPLPFDHHAGMN